jgi:serine/threonine-protein kinase
MDDLNSPLAARLAATLEGAYTIEGEIGRGGMGVVYSARDLKLNRRVAIKLLPPDLAYRDEIRTRFMREAQTAARLSHPHIVPIHAVGEGGGLVYFVMGFVDGESLGARIKRRGRLPAEEVRRVMKETADALGLAHSVGVVHRDIKPDNILLEGTRGRVMVTDFGIAKALSEVSGGTLTGTGVAIGTPAYMSPEQAAGERDIDARSDLYSLGVVAFEMLSGELPFNAPTVPGILMKQITEGAPDIGRKRQDCPEDLANTVMRCLAKDAEDRWPTADALRRALESRKSAPYRPARPSPALRRPAAGAIDRPRRGEVESADSDEFPASRRRARRPARDRGAERLEPKPGGDQDIVRRFRGHFASYVSVCGGLMLLNVATGIANPWFLWIGLPWAAFGLLPNYAKLWSAGYSWRDVINRPPARDAIPAAGAFAELPRGAAPSSGNEFGKLAGQIRQAQADQGAVAQILDRIPKSERKLLPDILPTVESLVQRASDLARTLQHMEGEVDDEALARLDQRIEQIKVDASGSERDRRLDLLQRQRQALAELVERRVSVEAQFESCVLAVQNVRFDLLRLRSAGVAAVLDDLTSATQQARALSADVEAAISAAGEIRSALGKDPPR